MQEKTSQYANLILDRLKSVLNIRTDLALANYLGVKANTISTWKSRNTLDYELIFAKCDYIDLNWLITGEGEMLRHINKDGLPQVCTQTSGDPPECARCKDKDAVIAAQRAQIESQTELLDLLKQSRSSNDGQKRKTA